jgi:hypothetical protein
MTTDATDPVYAYRPSLLGAPAEFRLSGDRLHWSVAGNVGVVPLSSVREVRMTFKPGNMQPHRFLTEIWADHTPKLVLASSSWKSMVEQERYDAPYTAFVTELHRRLAAADAPTRFVQGYPAWIYWPVLVAFVALGLLFAILVVRALQVHSLGAAAFFAAFFVLFLWQGGNFFRRNRPGRYRPDALPPELLPKG